MAPSTHEDWIYNCDLSVAVTNLPEGATREHTVLTLCEWGIIFTKNSCTGGWLTPSHLITIDSHRPTFLKSPWSWLERYSSDFLMIFFKKIQLKSYPTISLLFFVAISVTSLCWQLFVCCAWVILLLCTHYYLIICLQFMLVGSIIYLFIKTVIKG